MKKLLSLLIAAAVTASCAVPAFAADSDKMKTALAGVKTRVEVPAELSVFRSSSSDYNGDVQYSFSWSSEDYKDRIRVTSDSEGRIINYDRYADEEKEEYPLSPLTSEQAQKMADEALCSMASELFSSQTDRLVPAGISGSASSTRKWFNASYSREKNGIAVADSSASVNITAYGNVAYVSGVVIDWDYDAEFAPEPATVISDPQASYLKVFPIELAYERRYGDAVPLVKLSDGREIKPETVMLYGFAKNPGYISAADGAEVTPQYRGEAGFARNCAGGAKEAASAADQGFTEEELAELDKVENLITADSALQYLKGLKALKLDADMKVFSSRISRWIPSYFRIAENNSPENERFRMGLNIGTDENSRAYATLDAQNGELLNYSRWEYSEDKNAVSSETAKAETAEFIKAAAAEKSAECAEPEINDGENYYDVNMTRIVNGIPYRSNTISASYDKTHARISSYRLDWDEITEYFQSPEKAIGLDAAAKTIFEIAPLEQVYVFDGESYRLCYGISKSSYLTDIDAVTGEQLNKEHAPAAIHYSDTDGHWAQRAIETLAEINITENADKFRPDEAITSAELITMFNNAFNRYIDKASVSDPDSALAREDAFVLMVRSIGFERVAKLRGIFSCPYSDSEQISADKLGYAAILTGFGVISGDAGAIRAKDNLTRAEAAMMIYNYLNYEG